MKPIDSIPIVVEESDYQLLQRYAQGSPDAQAAFAKLVARHLPLVYSVAVRRVGDRHLAEDIAQAVFLVLAKKAGRFNERTIFSNWLFCTTRYAAANALKSQTRRRHHEQKHQAMTAANATADYTSDENDDATFDWDAIAPLLDGALGALGRRDREAVLLKYIEGRSHRDVGLAMGISEEAARKRISRAIERLRNLFASGGVTVSVAAVVAVLGTQASAAAAPAGLAGTIAASVSLSGATGGGLAALAAGKGAGSTIITWIKSKVAIALLTMGLTGAAAAGAIAKWGLPHSAKPLTQLQSAKPQATPKASAAPALPAATQAPAKVLEGAIRTPTDTPADKAEVFIVVKESKETRQARMEWQAAMMSNPRNRPPAPKPADTVDVYGQQWPAATIATEAEGYFTFPAPPDGTQWMLVARHSTGYAEISHDQFDKLGGRVPLQAWGAVEGQLLVGAKPQANVKIILDRTGSQDDWVAMQVRHSRETVTDAQGHYSFKDVAPGLSWLCRSELPKRFRIDRHTLIDVKPGATLVTQIGGKGRPVIGRAATTPTNEPDTKLVWVSRGGQNVNGTYSRADRPGMKFPFGWERMSRDEQTRWMHEWETTTPEGRLCLERQWGEDFDINPDGSFRIDDLPPGKYNAQLRILITENHFGIDLVESSVNFEVPPLPAGKDRIDDPLDIGTVPIKTCPRLRVGKPAPDFTAKMLDGKPLKLSDYRGKTVVLKWWWNWSEMETEAAAMNRAYEQIAKEPDVVLITLGMDNEIETAKKRATDWKLGGIHGWAGPQYMKVIPQEYFGSPSTLCIIGPDGNVRAKSLMTQDADTEVAKVLLER
jgi:RNA polymerase sigma factor (sigma-70 family)